VYSDFTCHACFLDRVDADPYGVYLPTSFAVVMAVYNNSFTNKRSFTSAYNPYEIIVFTENEVDCRLHKLAAGFDRVLSLKLHQRRCIGLKYDL
jgi:hypothetical protein